MNNRYANEDPVAFLVLRTMISAFIIAPAPVPCQGNSVRQIA